MQRRSTTAGHITGLHDTGRLVGKCVCPSTRFLYPYEPAGYSFDYQPRPPPAEAGSCTRRIVEEELARLGVVLRRTLELCGCEAVKRAVAAGMGIAFVSGYSVTLEVEHGLLHSVSLADQRLLREISIISHKGVRPSVAALAFLSLLRKSPPPAGVL